MDRRTFIQGAAALSALSTAPAFSLELPKVVDPRLDVIKKQFTDHLHWYQSNLMPPKAPALDDLYSMTEKVCHLMVDIQPKMFIDKTSTGPSTMLVWPNMDGLAPQDYEFHMITTRQSSYRLDLKPPVEEINPELVARELLRELNRDIRMTRQRYLMKGPEWYSKYGYSSTMKNPNIYTYPPEFIMYMPAIPVRHVYPGDFTPRIGFKYRGGYTFGLSRVMRIPEDLLIEQAKHKIHEQEWAKQGAI